MKINGDIWSPSDWRLDKPCSTCLRGYIYLSEKEYICPTMPHKGKCMSWEPSEVLIIYEESPDESVENKQ